MKDSAYSVNRIMTIVDSILENLRSDGYIKPDQDIREVRRSIYKDLCKDIRVVRHQKRGFVNLQDAMPIGHMIIQEGLFFNQVECDSVYSSFIETGIEVLVVAP